MKRGEEEKKSKSRRKYQEKKNLCLFAVHHTSDDHPKRKENGEELTFLRIGKENLDVLGNFTMNEFWKDELRKKKQDLYTHEGIFVKIQGIWKVPGINKEIISIEITKGCYFFFEKCTISLQHLQHIFRGSNCRSRKVRANANMIWNLPHSCWWMEIHCLIRSQSEEFKYSLLP